MQNFLTAHEPFIRLSVFVGVFVLMAGWEIAVPRRRHEVPRLLRWSNNVMMVVVDTAILRVTFPMLAVGIAAYSQNRGWGLFNLWMVPLWFSLPASLLMLDFIIYVQHVVFHHVPWLWRLHRMHHSDVEFDVSTAVRFHPVEIVISMALKMVAVIALGVPAIAVVVFEIVLNAVAMFNHSNIHIPAKIESLLRLVVVTPDMHRVHHSILPEETNRNFGFNLPWWDRLFGTFEAEPKQGQAHMTIGLTQFRDRRDMWLDRMLWQPLRRTSTKGED